MQSRHSGDTEVPEKAHHRGGWGRGRGRGGCGKRKGRRRGCGGAGGAGGAGGEGGAGGAGGAGGQGGSGGQGGEGGSVVIIPTTPTTPTTPVVTPPIIITPTGPTIPGPPTTGPTIPPPVVIPPVVTPPVVTPPVTPTPPTTPPAVDNGITPQSAAISGCPDLVEMLAAHNAARARRGVAPLKWSDKLAAQARRNSDRCSKSVRGVGCVRWLGAPAPPAASRHSCPRVPLTAAALLLAPPL